MASIRKVGDRWRAEVRQKGRYRSASFASKREARQWAAETEARIEDPTAVGPETVAHALRKYASEVSPSKKGARWEQIRLQLLERYPLASIPIGRLSAEDLAQWRDQRAEEVSAASVNRELNLLSAVFERARLEWGLLRINPVRDIKRPRNPRPRDRRISDEEIERVLLALGFDECEPVETAQHQVAVAFLLAIETALRLGELMALRREHVHLDRRYLVVADSKNGDRREVALSTRAVALLKLLAGNGETVFRCNAGTAGTLFRRAVARAGIQGLTFHDSRHEAITRLARRLDVLDLARMVGHRDLASLRIYYNATAEEIAGRLG